MGRRGGAQGIGGATWKNDVMTMSAINLDDEAEAIRIAYSVAAAWRHRFAATMRHWRDVDANDVDQVAALGAIKALRAYDPSKGVPLEPWLRLATWRRLASWWKCLRGPSRAPMNDALPLLDGDAADCLPIRSPWAQQAPDDPYEACAAKDDRRVRRRLAARLLTHSGLTPIQKHAVRLAWLRGCGYDEAAARMGKLAGRGRGMGKHRLSSIDSKVVDNALQRARSRLLAAAAGLAAQSAA